MADRLGDPTARQAGRLSLNPLRHVDPIGTVVVPLALLAMGATFLFGWAKPVPVQPGRLRRPRRDMGLVAVAGPAANLLMAIGWALAMKLGLDYHRAFPALAEPLFYMGRAGLLINVALMVLNLLPLPPLDGGRILVSLLPPRPAMAVARVEPFGILILLALMFTHVLPRIMGPAMDVVVVAVASLVNLR
ncbi:MAG: site-2 protease family protein [Ectothiorhodospiraceae bacterium]|nr:site-2 protease family protein [Chromatiales bacterium]MCP5155679.1 site-2 protease family protein [Ectothiorhodospiraceae bacterium]